MKIYMIKTLGVLDIGAGIAVSENEEKAKELFSKYYTVKDGDNEDTILDIQEISLDEGRIIFYDDGYR